jgi:APA family basic amino acid/polyamine antiporter
MSSPNQLARILSTRDTYMLIVGNIIGVGIFTTTGYIARFLSEPGLLMAIWVVGGFISFCGGISYAELSTRYPLAGGDFHYLSRAFHPLLGFLFGWSALLVTYTGSIAVISVGFGHYFLNVFPPQVKQFSLSIPLTGISLSLTKIIALAIGFIFSYSNVRGVRTGAIWQRFLTLLSILILLAYLVVGFSSPRGNWEHLAPLFPSRLSLNIFQKMGVALIGVYFTYSGWTVLAYLAGEIKDYQANIPRVTWLGVATVTLLYVLMNILYLYATPLTSMADIIDIGHRVLLILWGEKTSLLFTWVILIAVLSTLNATVLSGARIYYAMSQQGRFFPAIGSLHPQYGTPAKAIWLQYVWTVLLILSGSFNQLLTYTVFIMVCFGFLSGISLFLLRKRDSQRSDIYLAWGYPFTTLLYLLMTLWIMINTLQQQPRETLLGLLLVLVGVPFYFYFQRKTRNKLSSTFSDS